MLLLLPLLASKFLELAFLMLPLLLPLCPIGKEERGKRKEGKRERGKGKGKACVRAKRAEKRETHQTSGNKGTQKATTTTTTKATQATQPNNHYHSPKPHQKIHWHLADDSTLTLLCCVTSECICPTPCRRVNPTTHLLS